MEKSVLRVTAERERSILTLENVSWDRRESLDVGLKHTHQLPTLEYKADVDGTSELPHCRFRKGIGRLELANQFLV